jgi:hypothetical protein
MNGSTALPNVQCCQHRLIDHYWTSKPICMPTDVNAY